MMMIIMIWEEEMEMVEEHNKEAEVKYQLHNFVWESLSCFMIIQEGLHTYTLGENEFSDWTLQEFLDSMTGYK